MSVLSADESEFATQVNSDIRDRATPEVHAALRSPENLDRWITHLKKMKRDTESQLAANKATRAENRVEYLERDDKEGWLKYLAQSERWRSDAIRFKNGTENKLDEAMLLRGSLVKKLHDAILTHKEEVHAAEDADDVEIGIADDKLWSVLDDD